MSLDPTKIHVEAHGNPVLHREASFQEVMAEQVRHSPWLLVSLVVHGIVFAVFYMMPGEAAKPIEVAAQIRPDKEEVIVTEEPPPPEKPREEKPAEDPVLQDAEVTETEVEVPEAMEFTDAVAESAFDDIAWNTAVGIGGGAAGKFKQRGGGRRNLGPGGRLTSASIEAGLEWLVEHQDEDGKWDCDNFMKHDESGEPCDGPGDALHDVGVTGLALLAFLGDGSTMRSGPYREVVKRGVRWLCDEQNPDTGLFGGETSAHFIYDHVIATLAMCEAYGLSRYRVLEDNAQKAINYLEAHRNPYGCWRYQPRGGDNDMSVTGWAVLCYVSAKEFGLAVNTKALELADAYIDEMTDATGRTGYTDKGGRSSRHLGQHLAQFPVERTECMTSVGLLCKFFLDHDPEQDPSMGNMLETIMRVPPKWEKDGSGSWVDHYYWYYGTYAVFQAGEPEWTRWSKSLTGAVVKQQRKDGNFKGSWDPAGAWGADGGRVYSTAILVLTLEAYYRYSRLTMAK
jgi:hypothetical protein